MRCVGRLETANPTAVERGGNNLILKIDLEDFRTDFEDFRTENGSSQGQNLAFVFQVCAADVRCGGRLTTEETLEAFQVLFKK